MENRSLEYDRPLRKRSARIHWMLLAFMLGAAASLSAEWAQQSIVLRPGWNAVWLEVTPEPNTIEEVFGDMPVKSVWRFLSEKAIARYVDDATQLRPDPERWLTWLPGQSQGSVLRSLHTLHGGTAYLIELGGASEVLWTMAGRPILKEFSWISASYSLTGFNVDPAAPMTFAQFFAGSAAHQNQDIRRMRPDGSWTSIAPGATIRRGEAYWVFCGGLSSFQGPARVLADQQGRLDFGSTVVEHTIILANHTAADANFTLALLPASPPPGRPSGGAVLLSLWRDDGIDRLGWEPLEGNKSLVVRAQTKKEVRLSIRRSEMRAQGGAGPFHSILQVKGLGASSRIGIVAEGWARGVARAASAGGSGSHWAGLWVGHCVLNQVNEPAGQDPEALQPAASEASFRLLLRVAPDGTASLLREATVLWLEGLTNASGILTEPGRYLVAGSDVELAQFETIYGPVGSGRLQGAAVRDGRSVGRRISSAGFSFTSPQPVQGGFSPLEGTLTCNLTVAFDDDLNPYKHRYHPDHDNWDSRYERKLPEGRENFAITRQITLNFESSDPEDLRLPGWGDTVAGGRYAETILGLHRHPVKVAGAFRLTRVVAQ